MYPELQLRKPPHRRAKRTARATPPTPPDPPVPVTASVNRLTVRHFQWYFDMVYDASGRGSWVAGDFSELIVEGRHPLAIVEAVGEDGTLTLEYEFDPDPGPLAWEASAAPAVLVFGGGAGALTIPQSGEVNQ